jgi:hypothetical protein
MEKFKSGFYTFNNFLLPICCNEIGLKKLYINIDFSSLQHADRAKIYLMGM